MHHNNNDLNKPAEMNQPKVSSNIKALFTDYKDTGFFSRTLIDYVQQDGKLAPFYQYRPDIDGIKKAIEERQATSYSRTVLVNELSKQYEALPKSDKLQQNLDLLLKENTYTITTAHQPNIFTGPLYFVYKILHAVQLAARLQKELPAYNFVPVYYMGSEDADLDELGTININGKAYTWNTKQNGAVGRMKVDKAFIKLIEGIEAQVNVLPFGKELTTKFRRAYKEGQSIQQATLELVNDLFGDYGLIVLIPDNPALKNLFAPVIRKEIEEQFSHKLVAETLAELEKHYKVQAGGREINLFYLINDNRERIELEDGLYEVKSLGLKFTLEEILKELDEHPERFSPNVILRGALQETVLPNIIFIGGGGELAYWLELKKVFQSINVPYPVLVVRNSFLLVESEWSTLTEKTGLPVEALFNSEHELMNRIVALHSSNSVKLNGELGKLEAFYNEVMQMATKVDNTLHDHVAALKTRSLQKLQELEKKMLRAEKRKFDTELQRIRKIKSILFPKNSLQERVENIAGFYSLFGKELLNILLSNSLTLEQQFTILEIE